MDGKQHLSIKELGGSSGMQSLVGAMPGVSSENSEKKEEEKRKEKQEEGGEKTKVPN